MLSKIFIVGFLSIFLIQNILCEETTAKKGDDGLTCADTAKKAQAWLIVLMVIPSLLNIVSVILLIFSMILIRRLKSVVEAIASSTHWLTRTAIRVGLGPTAKKALIEYAKGKPEFKRLLG
uniref:Uncharacterized protein n=1 Tax=Panagrolaimus sp. PS1159 TaxID=55785 RepID=A0AC35GT30_9BILA